jgi:signal transduction histidine kinase
MGIYLLNYLAMMFLPHAVIFPKIGFLPQTVEFFYHLNILFTLTMITSVAAFVLTLNDKYILEILAKNESMTINQSKLQEEIRKRKESEEGLGKLFAELSLSYKNLEQISFMVSHNIRAPLTNILGYASLYEKSTDSAGANHLIVDGIEKSAKVLDEMLSDMNSILKSKNEVTGKRETLFFSDIVTDSANALKLDIEQNGIIVKHNFPKNQMITTSKSVIKSIVYNLLANAVKYRQQNGTAEIIISLNSNENDGVQTLTVEDNGIGMDLEKIEDKLFQLYSRFNNSGIEGKGIGLYLVKSHVESMGGTIKVQSRLNMGTKFIIILPNN